MYDLCQQLAQAPFKVQVVACCGTNTRLLKKLKHWSKHRTGCFHVLGYTSNIPALMAQADVVMTKPGPGVMMEATAAGVPLLIDATRYTMFQERGNAEYVENHHLGYVMRERDSFLPLLKRLLFDTQAKAKIQKSIAQHQRPEAAMAIADAVYEALSQRE